jgi:hypothetical protein
MRRRTHYVGGASASLTFLGFATSQDGGGPAYTFAGVTLARKGLLVLAINGDFNAFGRTLNSVTVNGVGMTADINEPGVASLGTSIAAIYSIALGAGATGSVVMNFSNTMTGASYAAYLIEHYRTAAHYAVGGNRSTNTGITGVTSLSATIDIPARGAVVVTASCVQTSISLTGFDTDGTQVVNSLYEFITGSDQRLAAATGYAFSSSKGAPASAYGLAAASWQ